MLAQHAGRWGQMIWNSERWGKKYFVLGRLEQPRQDKKLLFLHDKPNKQTKEGPLLFYSLSPLLPSSFISRHRPPLSSLSASNTPTPIQALWRPLYAILRLLHSIILDGFAIKKGRTLYKKRCVIYPSYSKTFADLHSADWHAKEISGFIQIFSADLQRKWRQIAWTERLKLIYTKEWI